MFSIKKVLTKDFFSTLINYASKYVFRFVLIIIIPLCVDGVTKGYWYTFGSIAALSMIADMGFTTIITQFSAHEFTHVVFDNRQRTLISEENINKKLSSLFKFSNKWAIIATLGASTVIFVVGFVMFLPEKDGVDWFFPWLIYVLATGGNFFATVLMSFFEGCGCIAVCQKIKLISSICDSAMSVLLLFLGFGLYALALPLLLGSLLSLFLVFVVFRKFIIQLLKIKNSQEKEWAKPILKLLWKYALSWCSGYIIYQIYTPLTFKIYGAEISGKVGYTLTIVSAIVSIAGIWNYISVPKINTHVEKKEWNLLDKEFKKNMILIEASFVFLSLILVCLSFVPFTSSFVNKYVLLGLPLLCLLTGYSIQVATAYIAVYLRAHKEEPLMITSIVTAVLSISITFLSVMFLNYEYVFLGFCIATALVFPVVCFIFVKRKRARHADDSTEAL